MLVVNHATSIAGALADITATALDLAWAVNARASVLLVKAFAEQHDDSRGPGRVVLFTSGQHLGPISDELPYAISKGAQDEDGTLALRLGSHGSAAGHLVRLRTSSTSDVCSLA